MGYFLHRLMCGRCDCWFDHVQQDDDFTALPIKCSVCRALPFSPTSYTRTDPAQEIVQRLGAILKTLERMDERDARMEAKLLEHLAQQETDHG